MKKVNAARGEFLVTIDGEEHVFCLDMECLGIIEADLGGDKPQEEWPSGLEALSNVLNDCLTGKPRMHVLKPVAQSILRAHGIDPDKWKLVGIVEWANIITTFVKSVSGIVSKDEKPRPPKRSA